MKVMASVCSAGLTLKRIGNRNQLTEGPSPALQPRIAINTIVARVTVETVPV